MRKNRPIVVAYDISDNKARRKVFKILKSWRIDGQKSVHECRLSNYQAEELFLQISDPINQSTDRLMMAWLSQNRKILIRGKARNLINCQTIYGGEQ
ncbi:CRISPR-associated protein Cas2 [Candidatus Magnetomorum sp. HK-1]|nr:CRISPR-associated protein Cas2 [Candidatus Magnetomorum sp. HK-1]